MIHWCHILAKMSSAGQTSQHELTMSAQVKVPVPRDPVAAVMQDVLWHVEFGAACEALAASRQVGILARFRW